MKTRSRTNPSAAPTARSAPPQHILVPFDFSEGAKLALQHAIAYALKFKARLMLLHVVNLPYQGIGFGPGESLGVEGRLVAEISRHLSGLAEGLSRQGVAATAVVRLGYPALDVVEVALHELIDLIIMGTHGRTGLKHVLLGSVAERVVRHAPCPVLVVRPLEREERGAGKAASPPRKARR